MSRFVTHLEDVEIIRKPTTSKVDTVTPIPDNAEIED